MENDIENDQELYSYFVQRNATLCEDNFSYLMKHKEVKLLINDYLANILLHKPDDVFKFTKDYYRILSDEPLIDKILILVGPEGSGKSSLVTRLMKNFPDKFEFPGIHTTRKVTEKSNRNYYLIKKEEFLNMINNDEFIEHKFEDDDYEGINRKEIERIFQEGKVKIGIEEANNIYNAGVEGTYIAILPPSLEALRERLKVNEKGNTATINKLLESSNQDILQIQASSFFSHKIINDDLERGYEDFKNSVVSSFPLLKPDYHDMLFYSKNKIEQQH